MAEKVSKAEKVLRQEIDILQDLDHPNIIKYIESFESVNKLIWVLELCKGGTLQELIETQAVTNRSSTDGSERSLSDEDASQIMKNILSAVSYLHNQGIVHRDLKPENILLNKKGDIFDIKLIDFGLTTQYNDAWPLSLLDDHWGTMLYMAPEVAMKHEYSKSIDIWSLGIIMYNLLSGGAHPLHQKGETSEQYKQKLKEERKFTFDSWFSSLAQDLISKMNSYSPMYRYNIGQVLTHPWITRSHETKVPLTCIEMLNNINSEDKLKKVSCISH